MVSAQAYPSQYIFWERLPHSGKTHGPYPETPRLPLASRRRGNAMRKWAMWGVSEGGALVSTVVTACWRSSELP
jgi:hypothetical protein